MVTGAAGFVGTRVCKQLRALGVGVVALDNLSVGKDFPEPGADLVTVEADIRDRAAMKAAIADHRPEAVLHLAAVHHIPTCEAQPYLALDTNVMGTQSLLEAIEESDCAGLVIASSGAVYDWSEDKLVEDMSPLGARDVYATSKLANEYQIASWAHRKGKRAHAVRLFNVIGSNDPNGHLIPDILGQIAGGAGDTQIIRLGNTKPRRDYIFVDDAATGFIKVLGGLAAGPVTDVFNLSRGEEFSVADIVEILAAFLGRNVKIELDPSRVRKVDRLSQLGDLTKLQERFGWRPGYALKDSLAQIVREAGLA